MATDKTPTPLPSSTSNDQDAPTGPRDPTAATPESLEVDEADDSDLSSVFNEDEDFVGSDGESGIPRNYNRQRPINTNQQKPNINDQVIALSKHANKIRLDNVKGGQDREKDKADRATTDQVLDRRTRMILYQMINHGVFDEVNGAISTGKEANVYGALAQPDPDGPVVHRAVKVYKTAILSFKDREKYITGEYRFKSGAEKGNNRKMVKLWAEKEFRNLRRIYSAGVPCPEPLVLKLHVLAMGFLGNNKGYAYPRLRDANIADEDADQIWRQLYIQLLGIMRRLYQVCRLVHADLSEYNILYNNRQLYIIDVSQSVEHDHPRSLEFLRMDIKNTGDFFRRKGVDTLSDRDIFDFITNSQGAVEEPGLSEAIEKLYTSSSNDETTDKQEVDNEVFRKQFIPQTLEQVYDIEKDAQAIGEGEGDKLVYRNLLADQVVTKPDAEDAEDASSVDESDGGATLEDDSGSDSESAFSKGPPRGKRFQDKEAKKQHKHAVKEAKAEKRKEKMPKHIKKRMVAQSSKRKNK